VFVPSSLARVPTLSADIRAGCCQKYQEGESEPLCNRTSEAAGYGNTGAVGGLDRRRVLAGQQATRVDGLYM
jgi:hypothetical protein